jgi:hypothetical protein
MTGWPERGHHCLPREPDGERLEIGGSVTAAGHHVNGPRAVPGYRVELTRPLIVFALGLKKSQSSRERNCLALGLLAWRAVEMSVPAHT